MKLPELIRRVRQHLAEAGSAVMNDDDIAAQIVRSAKGLAREYSLFKGAGTAQVVDGGFTPPDDFGGLIGPLRCRDFALDYMTPAEANDLQHQYGYAQYWGGYYDGTEFDTGGRVLVWGRLPAGTVTYQYHRIPAPPTAERDAWEGVYEEYHDLIALHAADRMSTRQGPSAAAQQVWAGRLQQRINDFGMMRAMQLLNQPSMQVQAAPRRRRY